MTPQPGSREPGSPGPDLPPEAGDVVSGPIVGTMLRDARLHRGLTIAEVAADTRINPAYLEALEAERWELMPAPVYTRGFFRSYARYLGLPDEAIERLLPRNLPRPIDLEPVAGLRKRASEAPLSLPTLPALRWPTLAPPRRERQTSTQGGGTARVTPAARAGPRFAPLGRGARSAGTGLRAAGAALGGTGGRALGGAARGLRGFRGLDVRPTLGLARRIEPRVAAIAGGTLVVAVLLLLAVSWLRAGETSTVAGPEPASTAARGASSTNSTAAAGTGTAGSGVAPAPVFKEGEMPDLAGTPRRDAEALLTRLGLTFVVVEVANASVAPGTVYNHSPQAGKSIKRGDAVTLVVARAP